MTSAWNKWKAKGEELANKANAERNKVQGELTQDLAEGREKANSGLGNLKEKWSEQTANAKAMADEKRAQFEEYKASNEGKSLHERLNEGTEGLQEGVGNAYQKTVDGYKAAGEAKDVAKQKQREYTLKQVLVFWRAQKKNLQAAWELIHQCRVPVVLLLLVVEDAVEDRVKKRRNLNVNLVERKRVREKVENQERKEERRVKKVVVEDAVKILVNNLN